MLSLATFKKLRVIIKLFLKQEYQGYLLVLHIRTIADTYAFTASATWNLPGLLFNFRVFYIPVPSSCRKDDPRAVGPPLTFFSVQLGRRGVFATFSCILIDLQTIIYIRYINRKYGIFHEDPLYIHVSNQAKTQLRKKNQFT